MELTREEMITLLGTFDYVNDMGGLTSDELDIEKKIIRWLKNNVSE